MSSSPISNSQTCVACSYPLFGGTSSSIRTHLRANGSNEVCAIHEDCAKTSEDDHCPGCQELQSVKSDSNTVVATPARSPGDSKRSPSPPTIRPISPPPSLKKKVKRVDLSACESLINRLITIFENIYTLPTALAVAIQEASFMFEGYMKQPAHLALRSKDFLLKRDPYLLALADVIIRSLWNQLPTTTALRKIPIHLIMKTTRVWHAYSLYLIHDNPGAFGIHLFNIFCEPLLENHFKKYKFSLGLSILPCTIGYMRSVAEIYIASALVVASSPPVVAPSVPQGR